MIVELAGRRGRHEGGAVEFMSDSQPTEARARRAISQVTRLKPSALFSAVNRKRNVWTSLWGGEASMTSPSMMTSGKPTVSIPVVAFEWNFPPGLSSYSVGARYAQMLHDPETRHRQSALQVPQGMGDFMVTCQSVAAVAVPWHDAAINCDAVDDLERNDADRR